MSIKKQDIIAKYGLTNFQYQNLRRRTGERITNAVKLYGWTEDDGIPGINQLIDYSLKQKRQQNLRFEAILKTPASKPDKISKVAQRSALKNMAGYGETIINGGFGKFAGGIPLFITMYENAMGLLKERKRETYELKPLPKFGIGISQPFGTDPPYYITNTDVGKQVQRELNEIVDMYNEQLANTYPQNALSRYNFFVRLFLEKIHYADTQDAIAGSKK